MAAGKPLFFIAPNNQQLQLDLKKVRITGLFASLPVEAGNSFVSCLASVRLGQTAKVKYPNKITSQLQAKVPRSSSISKWNYTFSQGADACSLPGHYRLHNSTHSGDCGTLYYDHTGVPLLMHEGTRGTGGGNIALKIPVFELFPELPQTPQTVSVVTTTTTTSQTSAPVTVSATPVVVKPTTLVLDLPPKKVESPVLVPPVTLSFTAPVSTAPQNSFPSPVFSFKPTGEVGSLLGPVITQAPLVSSPTIPTLPANWSNPITIAVPERIDVESKNSQRRSWRTKL